MEQKSTISYPAQFAILLGLMGFCMIISAVLFSVLGTGLLHVPLKEIPNAMNRPENADITRLLNTLAAVLVFLSPAFIWARIISRQPFVQLGFNTTINGKQVLLIIVITFAGMVLSGALGELNERIPIPAKWFAKAKALEETYKAAMMAMAHMKNTTDYLLSLLVLAVAPAIFEEVLFRGGFQQVFIGWTKSKWAGIIITSFLFSVVHFSYFGFLPRLALGIILGLVFFYSKNIWLNIFLHFLNNAFVVTELYILFRQKKNIEKAMDETMPMWWGLIASVLLVIFFIHFKRQSDKVLVSQEKHIHSSPENLIS